MNNSVYYKATDEDGKQVIKHAWKKHKYLYIKNGKYVYPEDLQKTAYKGPTSAINAKKAQQEKERNARAYKGPTSAMNAKKAQKEKEIQARARAINARTVAMKKAQQNEINKMNTHLDNAYSITKKHNDQVRKEIAERKERPKKIAKKVIKMAEKDSAAKIAYAKRLANKASKSPTVISAKNKAKSVASKAEYKVTRAGQKLANDVKKSGAYKTAKKTVSGASKSASSTAKKAYSSAEKAYSSAKKTASDTYKTAKKKVKKAKKTYNKYAKQVSNYIDWLSK